MIRFKSDLAVQPIHVYMYTKFIIYSNDFDLIM